MEAQLIAQRAALRCLANQHPEWTRSQLATAVGFSVSAAKKWLKRFREAAPDDLSVLFSRSRARHTPHAPPDVRLVERILQIRTSPPENLQRTPGPRAILYYLQRDAELQAQGILVPRSTRTIWKILRACGCILDPVERKHQPLEPCEPLQEVQMDFKDASTVPSDADGKRQHVVEVLNFVAAFCSVWASYRTSVRLIDLTKMRLWSAITEAMGKSVCRFIGLARWLKSKRSRSSSCTTTMRSDRIRGVPATISPHESLFRRCRSSLPCLKKSILTCGSTPSMNTPLRAALVLMAASMWIVNRITSARLWLVNTSCFG